LQGGSKAVPSETQRIARENLKMSVRLSRRAALSSVRPEAMLTGIALAGLALALALVCPDSE
jgi:hypothetical protein